MNPMAFVNRLPNPARFARRLDARRSEAVGDVLAQHRVLVAEARDAFEALLVGDGDARDEARVDATARVLLDALREVGDANDVTVNAARWVDRALRSERLELLDRASVPASVKRFTMQMLHAVNLILDSYGVWAGALDTALAEVADAHVYDLAAGTGGFMRHVARRSRPGKTWRLTSTDLEPEYVAIGERRARREGLAITFEPCDVLDLRHTAGVSLFVCTQATHHLSPGQVVRMIASAVRRAPRGILIVDLQRSLFNVFATAAVLGTMMQPLLHDGVLSVQRSYAPAELVLLAKLAGADVVTTSMPSATYTVMHAMGRA